MRTWIALLACLAACTPVGEPEPEENNDRVYGGGEVIVTFTLDEGVGFDGSITVAGSTAAEIQADGLRNATGLHVYEWDVPEETARNRFTINVVGEDITDDSGLTNTFSCDADLSTFHTRRRRAGALGGRGGHQCLPRRTG